MLSVEIIVILVVVAVFTIISLLLFWPKYKKATRIRCNTQTPKIDKSRNLKKQEKVEDAMVRTGNSCQVRAKRVSGASERLSQVLVKGTANEGVKGQSVVNEVKNGGRGIMTDKNINQSEQREIRDENRDKRELKVLSPTKVSGGSTRGRGDNGKGGGTLESRDGGITAEIRSDDESEQPKNETRGKAESEQPKNETRGKAESEQPKNETRGKAESEQQSASGNRGNGESERRSEIEAQDDDKIGPKSVIGSGDDGEGEQRSGAGTRGEAEGGQLSGIGSQGDDKMEPKSEIEPGGDDESEQELDVKPNGAADDNQDKGSDNSKQKPNTEPKGTGDNGSETVSVNSEVAGAESNDKNTSGNSVEVKSSVPKFQSESCDTLSAEMEDQINQKMKSYESTPRDATLKPAINWREVFDHQYIEGLDPGYTHSSSGTKTKYNLFLMVYIYAANTQKGSTLYICTLAGTNNFRILSSKDCDIPCFRGTLRVCKICNQSPDNESLIKPVETELTLFGRKLLIDQNKFTSQGKQIIVAIIYAKKNDQNHYTSIQSYKDLDRVEWIEKPLKSIAQPQS